MAVYVDTLTLHNGRWWCHMATDGNLQELHNVAQLIGLKRAWFQDHPKHPHYDLVSSKRAMAVRYGAIEVSAGELWEHCFM